MVYKPAVAHFGSELSSIFLANFDYATIDKTLFYEICKHFSNFSIAENGKIHQGRCQSNPGSKTLYITRDARKG